MVEWERRIYVVILVWIDTNSLSPVEAWPKPTPTWIIILLTTTTTQLSPEHFIQELGELYSLHSEREIGNCRISVSSGDFRNVYELIVKYNCFISSSCKKIQLTPRRRGIFWTKKDHINEKWVTWKLDGVGKTISGSMSERVSLGPLLTPVHGIYTTICQYLSENYYK